MKKIQPKRKTSQVKRVQGEVAVPVTGRKRNIKKRKEKGQVFRNLYSCLVK